MKRISFAGFNIDKPHIIGLVSSLLIVILSFIFLSGDLLYFLLGISFVIAGFPFFISIIIEGNSNKIKEEMFLEFSRNLVESVKAGTPISKSIINIRGKDYGTLTPYVEKLANQISIGIPVKIAFETFARDINSPNISRAVTIISEAENAGGQIEDILESVVKSVTQVEKLRKERSAAISSLVVQGYIIFLIFIVIMLVMQYKILPIATSLSNTIGSSGDVAGGFISGMIGGKKASAEELARPFFYLLIVQGFCAGLVIGKLSEGSSKAGLKHSFILVVLALMISTGAKLILGAAK